MATVNVLAIGGGAGGGAHAGGGGAGEVVSNGSLTVTLNTTYTITIGAGGASGTNGGDTTFSSITAHGGISTSNSTGGNSGNNVHTGGTAPANLTGGGGGSGGNGTNGAVNTSGNGGVGTTSSISGSSVTYAGGGGGGAGAGNAGGAGTNGGGNGHNSTTNGDNATGFGSGGGGGGLDGSVSSGGTGTSGLVIISYTTGSILAVGGTVTTSGGNTIHTFTSTGPFSVVTNLYWVGGTGNWDTSTATHWAISSGGSGGVGVPNQNIPVIFDGNSGGGTATISGTANCLNLTFTGYTGTLAGSSALNIYGNITLASGMTNSYTGTLTFLSTSSGQTITSATNSFACPIVFNGVGGIWTLQDALVTTGSMTITNGTVLFNNLSHSVASITNAGTLTMGSGTLSLSGTGTVWSTGGTINIGTSTIKLTNASSSAKTFSGGGLVYNNLWITGSGIGAYTIVGNNTFSDFKVDTPPHTVNFTALSRQTLNTFTVSGTAGNLMTLQSTVSGTPWFLEKTTSGNIVCDYLSLQDSHVTSI